MQLPASKCYYHPERGAVATCAKCGVGICKECAVKDYQGRILCYQCGNEYLKQEHRAHQKQIRENGGRYKRGTDFIAPGIIGVLIVIVIWSLDYFIVHGDLFGQNLGNSLLMAYMLFTIPFCYIKLNDLFAPKYDTGFAIYAKWMLKVGISFMLGWVAFPVFVIRFLIGKIMSRGDKPSN